ncbi:TPA: hypothetical protein I9Y37_001900 [Citrobacter freundii]|nr:hypothetical protein [Citrobacter freundii]HAT3963876.1 hypothetical protein [Citrobacter freundii]
MSQKTVLIPNHMYFDNDDEPYTVLRTIKGLLEMQGFTVEEDPERIFAPGAHGNQEAQAAAALSQQWIPVTDDKPDPNSSRRVCVFTPTTHPDMRYRFVSADIFKQVCSEATHWFYITDPKEQEKVNPNLHPDVKTGLDIIANTIGANVGERLELYADVPCEVLEKVIPKDNRFNVDMSDVLKGIGIDLKDEKLRQLSDSMINTVKELANYLISDGWTPHEITFDGRYRFSKQVGGEMQYRDIISRVEGNGSTLRANVWEEVVQVEGKNR